MNLDFDTIEIPEEKLNRTIQNNIKKVHGIHRKQMIRHTAGLFCAAAFFFCLSAFYTLIHHLQQTFYTYLKRQKTNKSFPETCTPTLRLWPIITHRNLTDTHSHYPRHIVIHRTFMSVSRLHLKKVFQKANEHKWIQMVFLPFI